MELIKIDARNPNQEAIDKAAEVLKKGGLLVYPTDTAYGLGANALNVAAVRKVYEVKARVISKPTHVVVKDWEMIVSLTFANELAKLLYDKFLPGPLTLVLPKRSFVPDILTANLPTLGVRIPKNPVTAFLSSFVPFPYTTPSANREGGKTPYSLEDVRKQVSLEKIDLVLDAGKLPTVSPSTMIDLSTLPSKIIREGPIKKIELEKTLGVALTI